MFRDAEGFGGEVPPKFGMGIERDRSWLPGFCPLLKHFTKVGPGWGVFKATLTQPAREGPPAEAVEYLCARLGAGQPRVLIH